MAAEETSSMSAYNSSLRGKAEICISSRNYATGWEDQHADSRSHIPTVCPCNCPNNSHLCAGKKTWCAFATYSTQTQHAQLLKCWVVFITHRKAAVNHAQKKRRDPPGGPQMQSSNRRGFAKMGCYDILTDSCQGQVPHVSSPRFLTEVQENNYFRLSVWIFFVFPIWNIWISWWKAI